MKILKNFLLETTFFISTIFIFSCEREISTSPPTGPVPIASIFITSDPPGAKIYEDGRNSGKYTPDSLTWLEEKTYRFTLKMDLFRDTTFFVDISKDEKKELFINYYSNPKMYGSISCTSNPDSATVFINGINTNKVTPVKFEKIWPGQYVVKCIKSNCRKNEIVINVQSNYVFDAHLKLTDTTSWVDYTTSTSGIHDNYLTSVVIDKSNIVWAGSAWGLSSFDGSNWTIHNIPDYETRDNFVNNLKVDSSNILWICTLNGLNSFDGTTWKKYKEPSLPGSIVYDVAFKKDGSVLAATNKGLAESTTRDWIIYNENTEGFPGPIVTGVDVDSQNKIWVVTKGYGMGRYLTDRWYTYLVDNANSYISITHSECCVWFGHAEFSIGLSSYISGMFRRNLYDSFRNLAVYNISIYGDEKWISTSNGLHNFRNYIASRTVYYDFNSGLTTSDIRDVAFDKNGNVWVATNGGGLFKFKYRR